LYKTFADSWRVNEANTLFYYESGLTPQSFIVNNWPAFNPSSCVAPSQPGVPIPTATSTTIALTQAKQVCSTVVNAQRRNNCIQDVMATGDTVFAKAFLQSQVLDQRLLVAPPKLISPKSSEKVDGYQVNFEWSLASGTENIGVTRYHCLWKSSENYNFNKCTVLLKPTYLSLKYLDPGVYRWKIVTETKDKLLIESAVADFEVKK
jgi:hypothetical protein